MSIKTRLIQYGGTGAAFEGLLAWDDAIAGPRPGILVAHTIRGRTTFEEGKARDLAAMGYCAFALDVYGTNEIGTDDENTRAQMVALLANRVELQRRLSASLDVLHEQEVVDSSRTAAIGFCFGGLGVIDLARIAAPILGAVSFHGLFDPPGNTGGKQTDVRVLALHGWDDPMATPDAVVAFGAELSGMNTDWQIHGYGGTQHAFTNPAANDNERGTVYDAVADRRSWISMQNFLVELFD